MKLRALLVPLAAGTVIVASSVSSAASTPQGVKERAAAFSTATAAAPNPHPSRHGKHGHRRSWNPNVHCTATVTTLATILGTQTSSLGGATYAGGGFKPGIPDKRSLTPPCSVSGVPTFVELDNVTVRACQKLSRDGDWACGLTDPNAPASAPANLKRIHIETGSYFRTAGGWSVPPGGQRIDVQGFVYWDPNHTTAWWHFYSGWEIHSFTAWRLSRTHGAGISSAASR